MIHIHRLADRRLERVPPGSDLRDAIWIDLYRPQPEQAARVAGELGIEVPSLADMEEIEISNRFYREDGADYMTVILPGQTPDGRHVTGPVTFILTPERLVTVRHHAPRPFDTYPTRADRSSTGCGTPARLFLGLVEEIVARFADLLEATGHALDAIAARVYAGTNEALTSEELAEALRSTGRQGEMVARVRLGLLTVERMLSVFSLWSDHGDAGRETKPFVKSMLRDMQALEVHADFLSGRVGLATDTTLGMVNLSQNQTVRIVSVVAVLFLPPTLIGTVYGMNFHDMPELDWTWGYPAALALMLLSALGTWAYFKWRGWL
ncbi:magnesium transporter CorA family protein [Rubellimicrobium aerolatum]|uniref:Magnesium transporter CorA family protein n=1 Tax=Rubellimicrobium aerolatum TaxID=490979 RepID=A0ABW0SGA2_9RHOB|nr:magnesium transporter CorA family protein [Rubellimicrobium aerolatum]MBP1807381.1 magnesium transporter [Rubellimicrobium aerolatum]